MSRLEELIAELCPDGVEYKKLGEIATISRGGNLQKKDFCLDGVPCIHYGQIYTRYGLFADKTFTFIGEDCAKKQKLAYPNDIVMAVTSENIEDVCKCVAWLGDGAIAVSGHTAIIHHSQDAKYLTYYFHTEMFAAQKRKLVHGTKVMEITPDTLNTVIIPVPPLPVQSEIVKILDNFTELTARKKQYLEYLNILIDKNRFSDPTIMKLGELFDFKNGLSKGKEFFGRGTPFIRYTDVYNKRVLRKKDISALVECTPSELEKLKVTRGDVLFTRTSETAEDVGWSSVMLEDIGDCVFNGFTIRATPKTDHLLPEYCAYCFSTNEFRQYVTSRCAFTTRASLTGKTIAEYELAVPSIAEQQKVVDILDKLYLLCNSLSDGLPAEIAARQKQYEYYRDKLLTFEERT